MPTATDFRPVQSLLPMEFIFPKPGTKEPFAIIRWVNMQLEGEPTSRWRAVTYEQPRQLIGDGYFLELDDAALACHRQAIHASVRPELNDTRRLDQSDYVPRPVRKVGSPS